MGHRPRSPEPAPSITTAAVSDGSVRVEVRGAVDVATADLLETALNAALTSQPTAIVVDLNALTFMDSSGIGALVHGYHRARTTPIAFTVVNCPDLTGRVLSVLGVYEQLTGLPADPTWRT
jgi:anti-sigma B factor antagonist